MILMSDSWDSTHEPHTVDLLTSCIFAFPSAPPQIHALQNLIEAQHRKTLVQRTALRAAIVYAVYIFVASTDAIFVQKALVQYISVYI